WWRHHNHLWLGGLIAAVSGGGYLLEPGDPDAGVLIGPGGATFVAPPGIDPGAEAAYFPEDPDQFDGPGTVTAIDPDSTDPGWQPDDDDDLPPVPDAIEEEEDAAPIDAVWQTTRNVRVSNGYKAKVVITVVYET